MCGRYILLANVADFEAQFGLPFDLEWQPSFNIAPGINCPILRLDGSAKTWASAYWGLIPHWSKDRKSGYKTINARIEGILKRPIFRQAIQKRRCLVPTNGFYEWKEINKKKQPYFIHIKQNGLFAFAGIWESWTSETGEVIDSYSILTRNAPSSFHNLHDRFPVALKPSHYDYWLEQGQNMLEVLETHGEIDKEFSYHAVDARVGKPSFNEPACIAAIDESHR